MAGEPGGLEVDARRRAAAASISRPGPSSWPPAGSPTSPSSTARRRRPARRRHQRGVRGDGPLRGPRPAVRRAARPAGGHRHPTQSRAHGSGSNGNGSDQLGRRRLLLRHQRAGHGVAQARPLRHRGRRPGLRDLRGHGHPRPLRGLLPAGVGAGRGVLHQGPGHEHRRRFGDGSARGPARPLAARRGRRAARRPRRAGRRHGARHRRLRRAAPHVPPGPGPAHGQVRVLRLELHLLPLRDPPDGHLRRRHGAGADGRRLRRRGRHRRGPQGPAEPGAHRQRPGDPPPLRRPVTSGHPLQRLHPVRALLPGVPVLGHRTRRQGLPGAQPRTVPALRHLHGRLPRPGHLLRGLQRPAALGHGEVDRLRARRLTAPHHRPGL